MFGPSLPIPPTQEARYVLLAGPQPLRTPLAFAFQRAEHLYMTPATKHEPTAGALRASRAIQRDASLFKSLPELIDRETGVREVLEILENIISEAGDLIESRSPELAAQARAALRRYADEAPARLNDLASDELSSRGLHHNK